MGRSGGPGCSRQAELQGPVCLCRRRTALWPSSPRGKAWFSAWRRQGGERRTVVQSHALQQAGGGGAGEIMQTGGLHIHLLVRAWVSWGGWHPSSAPEKMVMDRHPSKAAKCAHPHLTLHLVGWVPHLSATGYTGVTEALLDFRFKLSCFVNPPQNPAAGVSHQT